MMSSRLTAFAPSTILIAVAGLLCASGGAAVLALLVGPVSVGAQPPQVTVVAVYEGMGSYAEAVAASPTADRQALWREHVTDGYWRRCAEGGEYVDYAPPLATPFDDIASLRAAVAALRASSVEAVVRAAVEKSGTILPGPSTTVCLLAADSSWTYLQDMHGVGGFTAGTGKLWLTILPRGDWKDWITSATAHEYHHSVSTMHLGQPADMAAYLLFEGRADSFARLIDPQRLPPWTRALTPPQERAAWRTIQRHLRATSPQLLQGLMFGGAEGVRRWGGYTIGFRIVQAFLQRHPDLSVTQWTRMAADELLARASYAPGQ
jgi:uncharacterized protein YjaZ